MIFPCRNLHLPSPASHARAILKSQPSYSSMRVWFTRWPARNIASRSAGWSCLMGLSGMRMASMYMSLASRLTYLRGLRGSERALGSWTRHGRTTIARVRVVPTHLTCAESVFKYTPAVSGSLISVYAASVALGILAVYAPKSRRCRVPPQQLNLQSMGARS